MISNELFKELYNYDKGYQAYNEEQIIEGFCPLSPHDVAHKCKIWAYDEGEYYITSNLFDTTIISSSDKLLAAFEKATEQEAIFAAAQWIFDNKDN